jgi:GTP pyrophosphokinase
MRILESGASSDAEAELLEKAERFRENLPPVARPSVKLPEEYSRVVVLAAAQLHRRIASKSHPGGNARSDLDRARYGMVRTLSALGMWAAKRQLEDAVLELESPERCARMRSRLREFQDEHHDFTTAVERSLVAELQRADVEGRTLTAWCGVDGASRRLQTLRLPNFEGTRPPDFYDVHVLVDGADECYRALQAVHRAGSPAPGGFKDLIVDPHANGFSALTTRIRVARPDHEGSEIEETVNVIIQTPLMNEIGWHGVAHPEYNGNPVEQPFVAVLRDVGKRIKVGPTITVYTKGGRFLQPTPHELAVGGTVLDLAYKIHDEIGDEATSAVVDGELVQSLGQTLEEGAVVKIRRDPGGRNVRREDDLELVTTLNGRKGLMRGLRKQSPVMRGRLAVIRQLQERNVPTPGRLRLDQLVETTVRRLKGDLEDRSAEGVYRHIGSSGDDPDDPITAGSVAAGVADEVLRVGTERLLPGNTPAEQWRPVFADSAPIGTRFAKICGHCHPTPNDPIVGLKRRSEMTVHVKTCRHVAGRDVLAMRWTRVEGCVRSLINVAGIDRDGLVINICEKIERLGCGLEQVTAKADHMGKARVALHVYADSSATVSELVHDLGRISGVTTVRQDSMHVPSSGRIDQRADAKSLGMSRTDSSSLAPHVRRDRLPVRHNLINIPYDPQRPCFEGHFFGREDESETLIRRMKSGTSPFIFICGPRLIGKSSLALRFSDRIVEKHRPHVHRVDLRNCSEATSRQVFEKIVAELRATPFVDRDVPDREDARETVDALVASCDRPIVLILDEFGGPLESFRAGRLGGQFFRWIRETMEKQRRQLTLMMAGPPEAAAILHGVANLELGERLEPFTLRVLSPTAAREMFSAPFDDECIAVREGLAEMVADHCGGHPYYLIRLVQQVAARLDVDRRRWHLTRPDVNHAMNDLLTNHLPLSSWIAECAPDLPSQMCLDQLARLPSGRSQYVAASEVAKHTKLAPGEVTAALQRLQGHQVIERSPEGKPAYRSAFPLLHQWIRLGSIRKDYFTKLDPFERKVLLEVGHTRDSREWMGSRDLLHAAGVTADAVDILVEKNVLERRADRIRLALPGLRAWLKEERRRERPT